MGDATGRIRRGRKGSGGGWTTIIGSRDQDSLQRQEHSKCSVSGERGAAVRNEAIDVSRSGERERRERG